LFRAGGYAISDRQSSSIARMGLNTMTLQNCDLQTVEQA